MFKLSIILSTFRTFLVHVGLNVELDSSLCSSWQNLHLRSTFSLVRSLCHPPSYVKLSNNVYFTLSYALFRHVILSVIVSLQIQCAGMQHQHNIKLCLSLFKWPCGEIVLSTAVRKYLDSSAHSSPWKRLCHFYPFQDLTTAPLHGGCLLRPHWGQWWHLSRHHDEAARCDWKLWRMNWTVPILSDCSWQNNLTTRLI